MNRRIEEELFPFYALDALADEERAEVEAYIAADPAAKARLEALQKTAEWLPLSTEPAAPSPSVKANLMARVAADSRAVSSETAVTTPTTPVPKRPSVPQQSWWNRLRQGLAMPVLAGSAALAALLLFIWSISLNQQLTQLQDQVANLEAESNRLQTDLDAVQGDNEQLRVRNDLLQQQLQAQDDLLASYQQPGSNTIAIGDITGDHPQAHATLTVAPEAASAIFVAANLPPLGAEQVYQLWLIRRDQPISAAIFNVDENGRIVHQIEGRLITSFDAVGVSIEPAGGSELPTPDQIILLGAAAS